MWSLKSAKKKRRYSTISSDFPTSQTWELQTAQSDHATGWRRETQNTFGMEVYVKRVQILLNFFSRHILGKDGGKSETALSFTFKTSPLYKSGKWLVRKRPNRCDKLQHTCHRWNASTNAVSTNPSPSILKVYYSTTYLKGNSSKVH